LARIGTAWYTWLEQARDIYPSEEALRRIARALQLDETEKDYFLTLALECAQRANRDERVTPVLHSVLDAVVDPAAVTDERWNLLANNEAANALLDLDYIPQRNLLRNLFTPLCRALMPNWEPIARQYVAMFRFQQASFMGDDPTIITLVDELKQDSQEFRRLWAEQSVSEEQTAHFTLDHPFVGRLYFDQVTLLTTDRPSLEVALWICDGVQTHHRLEELIRKRGDRSSAQNLWTALASHGRDAAARYSEVQD
jgi:hypothetical protein